MWSHNGSHHEWETGREKPEDLQDSRSFQQEKPSQHGSTKLLAGQETSFYHQMTVTHPFLSGIVLRPPGTLKMSGHCGEMGLVGQGQLESDLLKLVWSPTGQEEVLHPGKAEESRFLSAGITRIGLLVIGLRFSSGMDPVSSWCPLQPAHWLGGSLEKLQTRLSAPTVEHGGGSGTIWGSFSLGRTGTVQLCETTKTRQKTRHKMTKETKLRKWDPTWQKQGTKW